MPGIQSSMFLIEYDNRERGNQGQANQSELFDVMGGRRRTVVRNRTLGVGDYALWWYTLLKILIERKTWDDLAVSLKSGHLDEQLGRMQQVREQTGCMLVLLVEGTRRAQHAHVESKNLQAKLDHIMINHAVHVMYTASVEDTVRRVYELMDNLPVDERNPPEGVEAAAVDTPQFAEANKVLALTRDHGPEQTRLDCFCAVPQLSIATARALADMGWSVWTLYTATEAELADVTYPSGNKLGAARAKKIAHAMGTRRVWIKILEQVHGVTKATAEKIFVAHPDPAEWTESRLAAVQKTERARVGPAVAGRIMSALRFGEP